MKRAANLISKIAEPDNLRLSFTKAARGKQTRREVMLFREHLHENLLIMRNSLVKGEPECGDYRFFTVYEPKKRDICAASFRERVIHHAIMNVVEPVFERYAIHDSYACRKNKGIHAAIQRAQYFSRKQRYCLKLDIEKYFDSIDHNLTIALLGRLLKDKRVMLLFKQIIGSYQLAPNKGMPIGNLISQHIANLYLGRLDHWIKESVKVKGYVRYMDDFLLFGDKLKEYQVRVQHYLNDHLKLHLHRSRQKIVCAQGIPYLGYRVFPDGIRLQAKSRNRFRRKFKRFEQQYVDGVWDMQTLNRHMFALLGFTAGADCTGLRKKAAANSRVLTEESEAITA